MSTSLKGRFLIASPGLMDPNFKRTVVLLAEHTPEGSFGLVLNRPGGPRVAEFWERLSGRVCSSEAVSFKGGPVEPGRLFVLHRVDELAAGSELVIPGLYLGGDQELLGKLLDLDAERGPEGGDVFRVYSGYAGWGKGQLDDELRAGGWLVQPAEAELVFSKPPESLWAQTMGRVGGPFKIFGMMPPQPELN